MFQILAYLNKLLLPSFTKNGLDVSKAKSWQLALIGYRYFVTTRAINQ
ncbi:SsrA-binding protein [Flavobacterium ovatum]